MINEDKTDLTQPVSSSEGSETNSDQAGLTTPRCASEPDEQATFVQEKQATFIQKAGDAKTFKAEPLLLIDDRFAVQQEIGRGGIGVTWLALDRRDNDNQVVIKALLERPNEKDGAWVERKFREEGRALSRIDHPGVVKFISSGVMPDGKPYLAMEYVEGDNLRAFIEPEKGVDEFDIAASHIRQLGEAISAAHDAGIYHRDLKPENIMVSFSDGEERIKVIDFGIATVKESLDDKTKATVLAGSARYIAPEQIMGKPTAASDIYALGVIAYEMITGRTPFNPDLRHPLAAMQQLLEMQRKGVRVRPKDLRPSLPDEAQEIILKALSFHPSERHKRADEFGRELASSLIEHDADQLVESHFNQSLASVVPPTRQVSGAQDAPVKEGRTEPAEPGKNLAHRIGLYIAGLLIATTVFFGLWYFKSESNERTGTNPPAEARERILSHWVLAQKYAGRKPVGEPVRLLGGEMYFHTGDELKLFITSADSGHLYLLSEEPTKNGVHYNLLFPTPRANNSTSSIEANAEVATDWIFFEGSARTEKVWVIWSASPIDQLESEIEKWKAPEYLGEIKDTARVTFIGSLLEQNLKTKLQVEQDEANRRMVLKGKGDTIIRALSFTHL
jgi:serine/threonine protein kinase